MQELRAAGGWLRKIRREIHDDLLTGGVMVVSIHVLIVMMLIRSHTGHVVMATVNIDVLMFAVRYMSMRMAQGCQQEADTHSEAEHAQQVGHRPGV